MNNSTLQNNPFNTPILDRLKQYILLTRLNRPIGSLLLLWPTLCALWVAADGFPGWKPSLIFVIGTILMRSAGCAINDYADRDIDKHVQRTKDRPLTSGKITPKEAVSVSAILAFSAFCLLFFTNINTILLSFIGLFLAVIYPFSKRFTHLPQLFLGAAFSWGIPMAYTAVDAAMTTTTWVMFFASVIWALVYDTMYAMRDRADDLKIGVQSTAILFGNADVLIISIIQISVLILWTLIGIMESFSYFYFVGVALAALFGVYQHFLIRNRDPLKCFQAFLNNHYFGMVIFIGIVLNYLLA